jgi:hypothetical protein
MLTELGVLVKTRLDAQVAGVAVWGKRQGQGSDLPSIVYDLQLGASGGGTAQVLPVLLIVNCYATTSDGVEVVAAAAQTALEGWGAWSDDVGLMSVELTNAQQDYDDEKHVWFAVLSFSATAVGD